MKARVMDLLSSCGYSAIDEGAHGDESIDYPDIAAAVSARVISGDADRGILICGTGIGMAIAANKHDGIRAAAIYDEVAADLCRRHNDVNVLCLSGDMLGERNIDKLIQVWLEADFEGGRHARRLEKITRLEEDSKE